MKKRMLAWLLAVLFCLSLTACDEDYDDYEDDDSGYAETEDDWDETEKEDVGISGDPDQTWAIYWYLCGSDLESEAGAATEDLNEMLEVQLPENVQVVIQTGGAFSWANDTVDPGLTERYVYSSEGMELVDQQPLANMGDPDTVTDFLSFCTENYPADRTMVIFWNHGGGSVTGVSFDENFDYDSLTLEDLYQGFSAAVPVSTENPPFDVVGFDACLMATIDTAYTFCDIARYMVASEELEPGIGWYYTDWLQALAEDPGMDGARLGQHICDSFFDECGWYGMEDEVTLSVVDLGAIGPLVEAYEAMGSEALSYALEDPGFFGVFGREAEASENYGGNTRDQGYSNMVDLGDLARNCEDLLPQTAQAVLDGLEQSVVYQVKGDYRDNASGLSCYYSYNGDPDDFYGYLMQGCSSSFKYLYDYGLSGELPEEGMEYVQDLGYEEDTLPYVPDLYEDGLEEYPLYVDEEGYVVMELEPEIVNMLKGVYFELAYMDPESDMMLLLGQDNDIYADWDSGVFTDNFRGVWGALDGCLVYMEVSYECEDYTVYSVPILLNDEEYNLRVIYDYNDEEYYILGARQGLDDSGAADKNLVQLRPGDEICTIAYVSSISGDDDFEPVLMDTLQVTEHTSFAEADLGDGMFVMMFELVDAKNQMAYSQLIQFTVEGEYVDVEIIE